MKPESTAWPATDASEGRDELVEMLAAQATAFYSAKVEAYEGGLTTAGEIERAVMLQILDQRWRDHLSDMDHLRDGIHLRAVAQQDPLVAWQREGFSMFEHLLDSVDDDFIRYVTHVEPAGVEDVAPPVAPRGTTNLEEVAPGALGLPLHGVAAENPKTEKKIGRNDPCHCGSGKKFKQCHGRP